MAFCHLCSTVTKFACWVTDFLCELPWFHILCAGASMQVQSAFDDCQLSLRMVCWTPFARAASKTSYFLGKVTKFVGNKTAIYDRNRSSLSIPFVKLVRLCVFSSFIRLITYATASQEHAFDASGSAKPEPQQIWQSGGANVQQKNPSPQTLRSPKIRDRLVVTPRSTAWSCQNMSSYGRVLTARSELVCFFFVQTFVDFALCLSSPWTMNFFLRNDNYGK